MTSTLTILLEISLLIGEIIILVLYLLAEFFIGYNVDIRSNAIIITKLYGFYNNSK
jgi:hypothetical protein